MKQVRWLTGEPQARRFVPREGHLCFGMLRPSTTDRSPRFINLKLDGRTRFKQLADQCLQAIYADLPADAPLGRAMRP